MNITDANKDGIALDGFDPVAHFNGQPLRGSDQFVHQIGAYTYHFANRENMNLFIETPAKFIPIAGGHTTESMKGNMNNVDADKFVGSKTMDYRSGLEDTTISSKKMPIDVMQDGDLEMQNLHDSNN